MWLSQLFWSVKKQKLRTALPLFIIWSLEGSSENDLTASVLTKSVNTAQNPSLGNAVTPLKADIC
jgi:hypothetical protein